MKIFTMKEIPDTEDAKLKLFLDSLAYHGHLIFQGKMETLVLSMVQMETIVSAEILEVKKKQYGAMLVIHKIQQRSLVILWDTLKLILLVTVGLATKL